MNRVPKQIDPCPINEVILEIRYSSLAPGEAIFGMLYKAFKADYPVPVKQPVLEVPPQIRTKDPNLMYLPEYHLRGDGYALLIGQRVFAVTLAGPYPGWHSFYTRAADALNRIEELEFIDRVERLGLRYLNAFDFNIFEKSELRLELGGAPLERKSCNLSAQLLDAPYVHHLRMVHGVEVRNNEKVIGESLIDIDTSLSAGLENFFLNKDSFIEGAHDAEKRLFFRLLSVEYLNALNPTY